MIRQEKTNFIAFIIAVIITCMFMCSFIVQKKGWHEDEVFSYGSSNNKEDNLFCIFAEKDSLNQLIDEKIKDENPVKMLQNITYYLTHRNEFLEALDEKVKQETPIWKTKEQAKDYVTVSADEIFSYWSVYYNQSRDVHPPLFYILVHLVSSICLNHFSKYIIFTINLAFYIASCFIIRKIMQLLNKDKLSAIAVLLYGLSMGALSIVMFQRMYVMLTFFVLAYLYFSLKICRDDFNIGKNMKRYLVLTTILGFLTQYYFCIYVAFLVMIMTVAMIKNKKYTELKRYIWCHIKAAVIGIVIFPASIYHIFFSYRGAAGGLVDTSYIGRLKEYMGLIFYAFSIPENLGYIITAILALLFIFKLIKSKKKDVISMITIPVVLFVLVIVKIAPFVNIRYIAPIFPVICIAGILMMFRVISNMLVSLMQKAKESKVKQFILNDASVIIILMVTIGISTYGLLTSKPQFLYESYTKRIELAEKYHELKFVYVGQSAFNHLQDIEEFLRYDHLLITNTWDLEVLKNNEGLKNETEFILNMKCWVSDFDENLNRILEYTEAKNYELLIDDGESRVYKIEK